MEERIKSFYDGACPFHLRIGMSQKGVGFIQLKVSLTEKRKEFFVVLFCDLEGLLQQFVAAPWKIMHWNSSSLVKLLLLVMEWNHFIERNGK